MAAPPLDFAAQAAALRAEAAKVREAAEAKARELEAAASHLEAFPGRARRRGLPMDVSGGNLASKVDTATRAAIGKHATNARGGKGTPLTLAAHAAGHSLRSLADSCGVSHSYLSQLAIGKRPPTEAIKAKVEALIGWSDWPHRQRRS